MSDHREVAATPGPLGMVQPEKSTNSWNSVHHGHHSHSPGNTEQPWLEALRSWVPSLPTTETVGIVTDTSKLAPGSLWTEGLQMQGDQGQPRSPVHDVCEYLRTLAAKGVGTFHNLLKSRAV